MSCEERLRKLQLPTLRFRRLRGDMTETYKILTGKYGKSVTEFMPMQNSSSTSLSTRGHILKLYRQRSEKGLRQNFFTVRVANQWNKLPSKVIESDMYMPHCRLSLIARRLIRSGYLFTKVSLYFSLCVWDQSGSFSVVLLTNPEDLNKFIHNPLLFCSVH